MNINDFILISDDGKSIEIKDKNGNSILMNADGITINSTKAINIAAKLNLSLSGLDVSAKGSATAELSSSGETKVKGALVNIN